MARFSETYDHFAKEILDQCGFKDHLFEEIASNITYIIKDHANRQTLSQVIQHLEDKVINDKSGVLRRFFVFAATMTFIDFISREAIINKLGKILESFPKDVCTSCEHMGKQENSDEFICDKKLDECPHYMKLSDEEKEALKALQVEATK